MTTQMRPWKIITYDLVVLLEPLSNHSGWNSQKMSHSAILRAKRASVFFKNKTTLTYGVKIQKEKKMSILAKKIFGDFRTLCIV